MSRQLMTMKLGSVLAAVLALKVFLPPLVRRETDEPLRS